MSDKVEIDTVVLFMVNSEDNDMNSTKALTTVAEDVTENVSENVDMVDSISGAEYNKRFKDKKLYMFSDSNKRFLGVDYSTPGIYDMDSFIHTLAGVNGYLCFDDEHAKLWISFGGDNMCWVHSVSIPDDAEVIVKNTCVQSTRMIIEEPKLIWLHPIINKIDFLSTHSAYYRYRSIPEKVITDETLHDIIDDLFKNIRKNSERGYSSEHYIDSIDLFEGFMGRFRPMLKSEHIELIVGLCCEEIKRKKRFHTAKIYTDMITPSVCMIMIDHGFRITIDPYEYYSTNTRIYIDEKVKVPRGCFTKEVCEALVKKFPYSLCDVPTLKRSKKMCWEAMGNEGWYGHVPWFHKSSKLLKVAIENNPNNICFIRENKWTPELAKMYARASMKNIENVPKKFITDDLYDGLIDELLDHADRSQRNVIDLDLKIFDERYLTKDHCKRYINAHIKHRCYSNMFNEIPYKYIDSELVEYVLKKDKKYLSFVPPHLKTVDIIERYSEKSKK